METDEQETPALEQDQSDVQGAPGTDGSAQKETSFTDAFDPSTLPEEARGAYEDAYKRLQADYTRKRQEESATVKEAESATQLISALNNPETRDDALLWVFQSLGEEAFQAVASKLGYELDGQSQETEDPPQESFHDPRVDQLLAEKQESEHQAQLDQIESDINSKIDALDKQAKTALTQEEKEDIFALVLTLDPTAEGPDVEAAFTRFTGHFDRRLKALRERKKDVPAPPNSGSPGVPTTPVGDGKARRSHALEIANQAYAADS